MEQWRARRKGSCNRTTGVRVALYGLYFLTHIENFERLQVLQKLSSLFCNTSVVMVHLDFLWMPLSLYILLEYIFICLVWHSSNK